LDFYSSTVTIMHGPINIRGTNSSTPQELTALRNISRILRLPLIVWNGERSENWTWDVASGDNERAWLWELGNIEIGLEVIGSGWGQERNWWIFRWYSMQEISWVSRELSAFKKDSVPWSLFLG